MNDVSDVTYDATATRPWRRWVPAILLAVAVLVLICDQLVKNWVVSHLTEGVTVPVIGDFLRWHFVRNPGAAFSMASGSTWIFTILAAVVVVVILWQIRRLRSIPWALFLGLLLGGVLGNLTDRLTREPGFPEGHVIDFISTPWLWLGFTEAIYNIADIAIVSGMIIFVLVTLLGLPIDGRSRAQAKADELAAAAASDAAPAAGSPDAPDATPAVAPEDLPGAAPTDPATDHPDTREERGNAAP